MPSGAPHSLQPLEQEGFEEVEVGWEESEHAACGKPRECVQDREGRQGPAAQSRSSRGVAPLRRRRDHVRVRGRARARSVRHSIHSVHRYNFFAENLSYEQHGVVARHPLRALRTCATG
eukprot:2475763-Prymnesium_polylepis.1